MHYCVNYSRSFRHLHEVDEIILNYAGSERLITFVPELVGENKSQRIILNILDVGDNEITSIIPFINKLQADGYNLAVITRETEYIQDFKNANIPFFFIKGASNLETAVIQCEAGVSDVYVVEELGFRIKDIQFVREKYGVKIRVFPNIAQSADNRYTNGIERFWIRPEDTELYEPYVDIFEILPGQNDTSRLSVIYEIYRDRQWLGNLNDIILDFSSPIVNNRGMNPHFGEMRLNCGKKCVMGQCNLCPQMADLANSFTEVGLEIIKKKYKPEITEEQKQKVMNKLKEIADEFGSDQDINNNDTKTDV